jgi:alpha-ketoglutarate-dependent taurine dioxygenase
VTKRVFIGTDCKTGDTVWASGYSAYEKLSPDFRKMIDGKMAVYCSAHTYPDRNNPQAGAKRITRIHPCK